MKKRKSALKNFLSFKWLVVLPVLFYKKCISPLLPSACIYYPSCSTYMLDSVREYGVLMGALRGMLRILRCVPWAKGGYDPVPINRKGEAKWLY